MIIGIYILPVLAIWYYIGPTLLREKNMTNIIRKTSLLALLLITAFVSAETVDVYIPPDVLNDYQIFLNGRDPATIKDFSGNSSRRDVVEVVLFMQALARTGNRWDVHFVEQSSYEDMLKGLEAGDAITSVTSLWRKDLSSRWSSLFMTTAVLERGQFEAGFYTLQTNQQALSSQKNREIRNLKGVSSEAWVIDWKSLQNFGANVKHLDTWGEMVSEVSSNRSDYLLAGFQATDDLSLNLGDGIVLLPIPNVKIALLGTRHFAISRVHPLGWEFNLALHRGLMSLKKDGTIIKAYTDCGFINTSVVDWREVTGIES